MSERTYDQSELDAFLRVELAGVERQGVRLESVPVVRWRSPYNLGCARSLAARTGQSACRCWTTLREFTAG